MFSYQVATVRKCDGSHICTQILAFRGRGPKSLFDKKKKINVTLFKNYAKGWHTKQKINRSKTFTIANKGILSLNAVFNKLPPKDVLRLALISSFGILKLCLEAS